MIESAKPRVSFYRKDRRATTYLGFTLHVKFDSRNLGPRIIVRKTRNNDCLCRFIASVGALLINRLCECIAHNIEVTWLCPPGYSVNCIKERRRQQSKI